MQESDEDTVQEPLFPMSVSLTPPTPRVIPWGLVLGAAACLLAVIALAVAAVPRGSGQPSLSGTVTHQATLIKQLETQVGDLKAQLSGAATAAQLGKLTQQVNGLTHLSRYGDTCTEPGFSFPCAPLG
jgi:hypothetical protein